MAGMNNKIRFANGSVEKSKARRARGAPNNNAQ
jgi:hypothetical protein